MKKSHAIAKMLERMNQHYPAYKDKLIVRSLEQAARGVAALETLAVTRSPYDTPEGHAKKVQAAAKKLGEAALKYERDVWAEFGRHHDDLTRQIVEKSKLGPTPNGVELRAVLRGMDSETRLKVVSDALRGGDHELISAVLCAPSIASGVPDQVRTAYREAFEQVMAPDLHAERVALKQLVEDSAHPLKIAREVALAAVDAKYISQIDSDEAAAKNAQAQMSAALS